MTHTDNSILNLDTVLSSQEQVCTRFTFNLGTQQVVHNGRQSMLSTRESHANRAPKRNSDLRPLFFLARFSLKQT